MRFQRFFRVAVTVSLVLASWPLVSTGMGPRRESEQRQDPHGGLYQRSPLPDLGQSGQVQLTVLATNDIHGGIEPSAYRTTGEPIGGMAFWGGVIHSTKQAIESKGGRVLVVDAGDQFQGTLISNINEGELMFSAMSEVGYDAVVPGNHDYDFGPKGWLKDRATTASENGREVIEGLAARARFPLLSANTYLRSSLRSRASSAEPIQVESAGCRPSAGGAVDWKSAQRPSFLKPFVIRDFGGLRVAIIGMDHPSTASMTTAVNVSDLCFRDPVETYREVQEQIDTQADVFLLVIHSANSPGSSELTQLVRSVRSGIGRRLDAVVAGHTHMIQKEMVDGVPIIQSGSGGERFGRIDFVFDLAAKRLIPEKTRVLSGLALLHQRCAEGAKEICTVSGGAGSKESNKNQESLAQFTSTQQQTASEPTGSGKVFYDQVEVVPSAAVQALVETERQNIADLATRPLLSAKAPIKRDRTRESAMANLLTDLLRETGRAELAFMNTGGIRADLDAGMVTYEKFFEVLPFANHAVVAGPMKSEQVIALLQRSIQTCGEYGALMQSGLRVRFSRRCLSGNSDPNAKLLSVDLLSGERLYDSAQGGLLLRRDFQVATLDFLLDGGSGYVDFKGTPVVRDLDIAREALVDVLKARSKLLEVDGTLDGRWVEWRGASSR